MLLSDIYTNSHTELSKDGNEGLISLDRLNKLWLPTLYELFREEAKLNNVILQHGNEAILALDVFRLLIAQSSATMGSYGTLDLTNTTVLGQQVLYWGVMKTNSQYNGKKRKIRLVSIQEFNDKYNNMMSMDIDENPIAYLYGGGTGFQYARIYPWDVGQLDFTFIKIPATPYLDYYINSSKDTIFLDSGTSHTLTSGETYSDGTTTGTKTSKTKELDIPVDFHPKYQTMIMEKIEIALDDQFKTQFILAKEQQQQ